MQLQALRIFVGYDDREPEAYEVCAHSLRLHTSIPIGIAALRQQNLRDRGLYQRPTTEQFSTGFAMTRFLTPHLSNFDGYSMFVDCDFLFTADIADLLREVDPDKAVSVVKHDYTPKAAWKMDGQPQIAYPRKNWSSLMIFNNEHPATRGLTRYLVNSARPDWLHQLKWARDEEIGELPVHWNWLEGEYEWAPYPEAEPPAGIHFTNGTPELCATKSIQFGDLWADTLKNARGT